MPKPMSDERLAEIRRNLEPEDGLGDDLAREAVELLAEVDRLRAGRDDDTPDPCDMKHTPPMDFAFCETHDTTFPLGAVCKWHGKASIAQVLQGEVDEQRARAVTAESRADRAEARLARVAALHVPDPVMRGLCAECSDFGTDDFPPGEHVAYPCPTIRALEGETDE